MGSESVVVIALTMVFAYVVGMFPTAVLVGRKVKRNPLIEGSGNPGASNMCRIAGRKAGLAVALVDIMKGVVPVLVMHALLGRNAAVAAWVGATVGHIWPVINQFRGGKGVATAGGGALALNPFAGLACLVIFAVVLSLSKVAASASLAAALTYPALLMVSFLIAEDVNLIAEDVSFLVIRDVNTVEVIAAVIVSTLMIWRHRSNISRLWHGKELKVEK